MGRGPTKNTKEKIENSKTVPEEQILEVFKFWKETLNKRVAALERKRHICIGNAISLYGVDVCKDAIRGCTYSEFHMGRNKMNKRYDSVELIFRDAEHIEKFHDILDKSTEEKGDW
jgi:hypothetical protein